MILPLPGFSVLRLAAILLIHECVTAIHELSQEQRGVRPQRLPPFR